MPIGKPLFEFAAAARTTDLIDFSHRFHRPINIIDDKTGLSVNNDFGDRTAGKTDYWGAAREVRLLLGSSCSGSL